MADSRQHQGVEGIVAALDWTVDPSQRMAAVIYGYFDDSGTNAEAPVAVMAGYLAHASDWKKFENKTKRLFQKEGIPFFRAKLFDHRQDQFRGWSNDRQIRFAREWCGYAKRHLMRGVSSATIKADLVDVKAKHRSYPPLSAQANCMQVALQEIFSDSEIVGEIRKYGLSLFIEKSGDKARASGAQHILPFHGALLATAYQRTGRVEDRLMLIKNLLEMVERTGVRYMEAELCRARAELLVSSSNLDEAEKTLHCGLTVARKQQARIFELRIATTLAGIWRNQGHSSKARELLAPICDWFGEIPLDRVDLKDAKALLRQLNA